MPDVPSETQDRGQQRVDELTRDDRRHPESGLRDTAGRSPDLVAQTPGLDRTRPVRDWALRALAWSRERRGLLATLVGGTLAAGASLWFAMRPRMVRPKKRRARW